MSRVEALRTRVDRLLVERLHPAVATAPVSVTSWVSPEPTYGLPPHMPAGVPIEPGATWGSAWGTTWFRVTGQVPDGWLGRQGCRVELVVDFGFHDFEPGFQAEAIVYRPDGSIVKAIEARNQWIPVVTTEVDLYLEAASNPSFIERRGWQTSHLGDPATLTDEHLYELRRVELTLVDETVEALVADLELALDLLAAVPYDTARGRELAGAVQRSLAALDPQNIPGSARTALGELAQVLSRPAHGSAQTCHATAHAHIDSAWLWPRRETIRKCGRTFANVLNLMDRDTDLVFTCSQMQQYAWVQDRYPQLFDRIRQRVDEGRWFVAGTMWVEADALLTGGESFVRQLTEGARYAREELGVATSEVWLPDSFGYSAALPQLFALAGKRHVFTQKLSWNEVNRMPSSTFLWEGIDGTRVLTHFSPTDTYNGAMSVAELLLSERQFVEGDRAKQWMMPYGYGDGGGGPTREMVANGRRMADLEGVPKVVFSRPDRFFKAAEAELTDPDVWSGELYLEKHRGTYTSQHRTKQGNRRAEAWLREVEGWSAAATVHQGLPYPYDELRALWRTVLYNQFHDILPGSSIAWVHDDAESDHAEVIESAGALLQRAAAPLGGFAAEDDSVAVAADRLPNDGARLSNGLVTATFDPRGRLVSLLRDGREVVSDGSVLGELHLHDDVPNNYDAWDIDESYLERRTVLEPVSWMVDDAGAVVVTYRTERSTMTLTWRLNAGSARLSLTVTADWWERQRLLKLALPLALKADEVECGIQFGHLRRPVHRNTSWERARYEFPALRWLRVPESTYGVAVASESTYGWDIAVPDKGVTVVRATLLRSTIIPDPEADLGAHSFALTITPGADVLDSVVAGNELERTGLPMLASPPLVRLADGSRAVIEAVKLADDRSGDVIVRLYEATGGRCEARLLTSFPYVRAERVDLHEAHLADADADDHGDHVVVPLHPFEIATVRFIR